MVPAILGIVEAALSIWDSKLKQKYIDKVEQIKRDLHAEYSKVGDARNNAAIDNLEFELRILADSLAASIRTAKVGNS